MLALVLGAVLVVLLAIGSPFALAPLTASRRRLHDVPLLGGLSRFIVWTPTESLIIHRNGRVRAILGTNSDGGSTFAFPLFGDSVHARLNLALRSFAWEEEVLTREALPCRLKLDVWWRVGHLETFVASQGQAKDLSPTDDRESHLLSVAETRLLTLTESTARSILAQAAFLEVLTTSKPGYLNVHHPGEEGPPGLAELSSDLASRLTDVLKREATRYGIAIDRVEVQNIRFAPEVEQELRDVWLSYLKPVRAEQEGEAHRITGMKKLQLLSQEVELLGGAAISTREIVKHLPDNSSLTIEDLLKTVLTAARKSRGEDTAAILDVKESGSLSPGQP